MSPGRPKPPEFAPCRDSSDVTLPTSSKSEGRQADLIACNNTLAQIPDLNDFVAGLAELLAPDGLLTIEVPHLMRLLSENQFDTIYHEHFSYFSLGTIQAILDRHGLSVVDVEQLPTHGGSLRVHARHADAWQRLASGSPRSWRSSGARARRHRDIRVVRRPRRPPQAIDPADTDPTSSDEGRTIAGYGAPGKANTLLNYCGIGPDLLSFTVDRNPYKQGRFTPGTRIPIYHPDRLEEVRPDVIWILPWNLRTEIAHQLSGVSRWGGRLFVAIPEPELFDAAAVATPPVAETAATLQ